MFNKTEQDAAQTQKVINTSLELLNVSLKGFEKLTNLQVAATQQIFAETSQAIKQLAEVTDAKEMFAQVNNLATNAVEKNLALAGNVYAIVSEVQAQLNQVAEQQVEILQSATPGSKSAKK